jgi:hypothetical protein
MTRDLVLWSLIPFVSKSVQLCHAGANAHVWQHDTRLLRGCPYLGRTRDRTGVHRCSFADPGGSTRIRLDPSMEKTPLESCLFPKFWLTRSGSLPSVQQERTGNA